MSERVFRTLAGWTLASDEDLRAAIGKMGAAAPADLDIARRLFALAVETPGGLKIQTIHAFCERVLHLFPFEANVPADFRVVEDLERLELLQAARTESLTAARGDPKLAAALARVARETWDGGFQKALDALMAKRELMRDGEAMLARLPEALGLAPDETEAEIERRIIHDGIHCSEWKAIAETLANGKTTDIAVSNTLRRAMEHAPHGACIEYYFSTFFTDDGKGTPRQKFPTRDVEKASPGLTARLATEARRLHELREKLKAARTLERTRAIATLAADVLHRYTRIKQARSLLDFDDLIARTRRLLLQGGASSWVLYKLDGGIDHILVDEAQDTSAAQWDILRALASEFTSGAGAKPRARTFFAVGDEKQSIFSFQGAAPKAFDEMRREFEKRVQGAGGTFAPIQLDLSFRSATNILKAVDAVFASDAARRGLTATPDLPTKHEAFKSDVAGMVEIWPVIATESVEPSSSWVLPLDLARETDPPVQLARRIARRIAAMTASESPERISGKEPGTTRRIGPGDVMILVRRRGAFFEAMVRALKEQNVPVAGADRLNVGEHIAVMDMIAAARTALCSDDDLALACVLKSPLCGLDDDDLIAIAPKRPASLWQALAASQDTRCREIVARVDGWRELAGNARPFDFFGRLLGPEGGRSAIVARMGLEAGDALDELLALALQHERQEPPSLAAFVHALEAIDLTVKRDMEAAGGLVRVMTAHAAKGLEAPVVFLPDTCAKTSPSHDPVVFELGDPARPALAWAARGADDPQAAVDARNASRAAADDEYRRLLYVAMTRAEERLYIAGYTGQRPAPDGCWYKLAHDALQALCVQIDDPGWPGQKLLRLGVALVGEGGQSPAKAPRPSEPAWLRQPARAEIAPPPPLRPSNALAGADAIEREAAGAGPDRFALMRGILMHALMQNLPAVEPSRRLETATRFVRARGQGMSEDQSAALVAEAVAVFDAPNCAPLFGPRSRAEIGIAARIDRAGAKPVDIAGRIDRIAEVGAEIWIVDFKAGAPATITPPAYVAQLALYQAAVRMLYPGRDVRAFVLWTSAPRLDEIAAPALDAALAAI